MCRRGGKGEEKEREREGEGGREKERERERESKKFAVSAGGGAMVGTLVGARKGRVVVRSLTRVTVVPGAVLLGERPNGGPARRA